MLRTTAALFALVYASANTACENMGFTSISTARVPEGFCVSEYATGFRKPRGIDALSNGDLLVIDQTGGVLYLLWDDDNNGVSDENERMPLVIKYDSKPINHAVLYHEGYIYASSSTQVYRWRYAIGSRQPLVNMEIVVDDIKGGDESSELGGEGGHRTRTLAIDSQRRLYVQCGSRYNVDPDSSRSMIRRFSIDALPDNEAPLMWLEGEVFADGLRNEVALDFDKDEVLWGAENGADNLYRADLGGSLVFNNPAEEVNRFPEPQPGTNNHYGYPYCWSENELPEFGEGRASQWYWPATNPFTDVKTDEWCRNVSNNIPPVIAMQAHSAPLGMRFNHAQPTAPYRFPPHHDESLFVAFHGSWNRLTPTGYKVVTIPFGGDGMPTTSQPTDFLRADSEQDNGWPYRPMDLAFAPEGGFMLTSGSGCTWRTQGSNTIASCTGGNIMAVRHYNPPPPPPVTATPTTTPSSSPSPSRTPCTNDLQFTTEYGNCHSYVPTKINHVYCETDGAVEACALSCKQECIDDVPCVDSPTFDKGFGKCDSYAGDTNNNAYCDTDGATKACPVSCGLCAACDASKGSCSEADCWGNVINVGGCFCDELCVNYGDCCCNYKDVCRGV